MKKNKSLSVEGFKSKLTQFDVDVDEITIIVLLKFTLNSQTSNIR